MRLSLIASIISLSTIAGATLRRFSRLKTPSSGTGRPNAVRSPSFFADEVHERSPRCGGSLRISVGEQQAGGIAHEDVRRRAHREARRARPRSRRGRRRSPCPSSPAPRPARRRRWNGSGLRYSPACRTASRSGRALASRGRSGCARSRPPRSRARPRTSPRRSAEPPSRRRRSMRSSACRAAPRSGGARVALEVADHLVARGNVGVPRRACAGQVRGPAARVQPRRS